MSAYAVQDVINSPFPNTKVVHDPIKGRCLETTVDLFTGCIVYVEDAFLYSSYQDNTKSDREAFLLKAYGKVIYSQLDDIYEELSCLPKIDCLDTARNFIQLVAFIHLKNDLLTVTGKNSAYNLLGPASNDLARKFTLLEQLTPGDNDNLTACIADVKTFREAYPKVLPKSITTERAGAALGLLNTNQVELEDFGGSGLFVGTAILEHNCEFNCSYTTKGSRLYLTCTKDIPTGGRMSIDYGNFFYTPTEERQSILQESYGFTCVCPSCSGFDRKRAYCCPACSIQGSTGVVCLQSNGISGCPCLVCNEIPAPDHIEKCLQREKLLLEAPPETFEAALQVGQEGLLHESHHLLFAVSDIVAKDLAEEAKRRALFLENGKGLAFGLSSGGGMSELFDPALVVMKHCCKLLDMVLPLVSPEKVIYHDRLGQLAVCAGHKDIAKQAFGSAYQMSCWANGKDSPTSKQLYLLAEKTPETRAELMKHYADDIAFDDNVMDEDDSWID